MKFFKIFVLLLLSLFFLLYSFTFMFLLGLDRTVFNIDHHRNMSREFNVFPQLHESLESSFFSFDEKEEANKEGDFMSTVFADVFDEVWLEEQFFLVLEDILLYTKGERESLSAEIDLTDKSELLEERVQEILIKEESLSIEEAEFMAKEIKEEGDLPEALYLKDLMGGENRNIFYSIIMVRSNFPVFSAIIFVVVLLFMLLLAGIYGGLKWYGTNMLISSSIFLIILILLNSTLNLTFVRGFVDFPSEFEFVLSLIKYTFSEMYLYPIIYWLVGLFFIILGILLGYSRKKKVDFQ